MRTAVLIPVYKPEEVIIQIASEILATGLDVVIVDDEGSDTFKNIFDKLSEKGCVVLHHEKNRGKGRALKTGIKYLIDNNFDSVITADADGQHSFKDILLIRDELRIHPDHLILGVRSISQMPTKSKFGNTVTKNMFYFLYGIRISDTQTGLRGLPLNRNSNWLLSIDGERYEYEMNILTNSQKLFSGIIEIHIETIYIDNNGGSHFRPFKDGFSIYKQLFSHLPGFVVSSLLAFIVDFATFSLCIVLLRLSSIESTILARVISASINFVVNKKYVFKNSSDVYSFANYFLLAGIVLLANVSLIYLFVDLLYAPIFLTKILIEIFLYFFTFIVQHNLAFKSSQKINKPTI